MIRTAVGLALLCLAQQSGLVFLPVSLAADAPVASAPGADKPTAAPAATPAQPLRASPIRISTGPAGSGFPSSATAA